jgi:pullulanase/glycogen debranching enzyme
MNINILYGWTSVIDSYVEKYDTKHRHGLITIQNGKKYNQRKYDQLIIYELYVADFTENGQFSGVLSKLDLGIMEEKMI